MLNCNKEDGNKLCIFTVLEKVFTWTVWTMSEGIMVSGILIKLKKERLTKAVSASNTLLGSIKTKVANDANATRNGAAENRNVWTALR